MSFLLIQKLVIMAEIQVSLADLLQQQAERLERIERGLLVQKTVLNFTEFCAYVGISKSHGYKLTSGREVPHYCPNGKTLFFNRTEVDNWLLRNQVKTTTALQAEVTKKAGAIL
jgi:excisionase family DNA binding protein